MRLLLIGLATFLLAGLGWFLAHLVPVAGVFAELEPTGLEQCRRVDIAPGTEDVTVDAERQMAFVSAADRRAWRNRSGAAAVNPQNGIYALSLDGSDAVRRVSPDMENFVPHGISLWIGPNGTRRLFVVNHPPSGEQIVEIFAVGADGALTHLESVSFDAMHSPNDVVAAGPRAFYATNDRGYTEGFLATLEAYMALPLSSVAYFDGENGRIVADGLTYANGINKSSDGETVYVAEFLKQRIAVYDRNPETGVLKKRRTLKVNTGPDNIEVAEDGALWIAGHPKVFEFLAHAEDENKIAPSQVIRLDPQSGEASDVFISTEGEISGSSVGAVWNDTLIVGAVFDGHVMICSLDQPTKAIVR